MITLAVKSILSAIIIVLLCFSVSADSYPSNKLPFGARELGKLITELPKMLPAVPATSKLSSDSSDSGHEDGRSTHLSHPQEEPFQNMAECTSIHDGRQVMSTILPVSIDTLFQSLYGRSKFLDEFHASRKITDIEHTEWSLDDENRRRRRFKCVMPIKSSIGPKVSYVTEIQTLNECSVPGNIYSIDITSWNDNIPYGDVFTIYAHHCLVRTVDDHTMVTVYVNIKFRKSIFSVIKNLIEKSTYSGIEEFHTDLALQLSRHFCTPIVRHKRHIKNYSRSSLQNVPSESTTSLANRASTPPRIETSPPSHKKTNHQPHSPSSVYRNHSTPNKFAFPAPAEHPSQPAERQSSRKCAWLILFLLIAISTLNVYLFLHLVSIRDADMADSSEAWLNSLRWDESANFSSDDWVRILQSREFLHQRKIAAMRRSLVGSIGSLKQSEYHLMQMVALLATERTQPNFYGSDFDIEPNIQDRSIDPLELTPFLPTKADLSGA